MSDVAAPGVPTAGKACEVEAFYHGPANANVFSSVRGLSQLTRKKFLLNGDMSRKGNLYATARDVDKNICGPFEPRECLTTLFLLRSYRNR